ncbi:MAG: DUF1273 family protein [Clostridiales bacterium]|nr:DUF1273 family protein [Clostridiales bacterium]
MMDLIVNTAKTVAVTGHRVIYPDFDREKVEKLFNDLILKGFDTFLVGMALGFDTECFHILEKIRKEKQIKIIACIPCKTQSQKFTFKQKEEYDRMLSVADEKVFVSEEYSKSCMQKRNQFMVDRASVVVAYIKRDFGGTANTVKYATKNQVPIIEIN